MQDQVITCPHCHKEIPLTEAISHQIRDELHKQFEAEAKKKEKELVKKLEKEARKKAEESFTVELKDLHEQVKEKDEKLKKAQEAEVELRKKQRELEDSKREFELEMARKLDEERAKIREDALKAIAEEHRLKDLEKEKQINDMRKQIEDLKRKAEQGSQQTQGEVLELEIEDILKQSFPLDHIEPVPKGVRGADILQRVNNNLGQCCGTIIWETKRTKSWNSGWIEKLKDDQREVKAEIAVLMTTALPKGVSNFTHIDGIWVTDYASVVGLTTALRMSLSQVADMKLATVGKNEKMETLYDYLSGPQFKQRVEAIVKTFISMKEDLDKEKRAMMSIWSKRDKQIERVIVNTAGMYGDMKGIIGASLPQIDSMELKALADGDDVDDDREYAF